MMNIQRVYRSLSSFNSFRLVNSSIQNVSTLDFSKRYNHEKKSEKDVQKNPTQFLSSREKKEQKQKIMLKKPINSYRLFIKDQKDSAAVIEQNGMPGFNKEMAKRWKELDETKKEEYKLQSQRMKEEHELKIKNDPEYFAAFLSSREKKPGNPYPLFLRDQKDSAAVIEQNGIAGFNKEMSKRWKELDELKKEEYKLKFQRMQKEHGYKMKRDPKYDVACKKKQAVNSFNLFVKDQKGSAVEWKQKVSGEYLKEMGRRWKELDESEKKEYELKFQRMQKENEQKKEQMQEKHEYFVDFLRSDYIDNGRHSYSLFCQDQEDSAAVRKQYGIGGHSTEMAKRWKELDESKREEYKLKSQRMQKEYEYKMKNDPEYFAAVLRSQVKKKDNSYQLFTKDQKDSAAVMEQNGPGGYQKEMRKRWKELDESKREEYKLKSQRMQEEHEYKMKNDLEYFGAVLRSQKKLQVDHFRLFVKDQEDSAAVRKQYGFGGYTKEMAKRWKELDEEKKEEYKKIF